ncbi:MAG: hypothetical protein R3F42_08470 [Pseudomonadota bacterium]
MENQNTILELQEWTATLTESVKRVAIQILDFLPSILGALVLLLAGWAVARLLRYTTEKITEKTLLRLAHSRPLDTRIKQPQSYSAAPRIASRIVFWVVMLFFILAAAEVLDLKVISGLLGGITAYLPRLLAGLLILFIGLWFGEASRAVITRSSNRAGIEHGETLGRLSQALVLLIVFTIAAGQVGIDNTVLIALVATVCGMLLAALALAFAIGAGTTIANMLAAQTIAQTYHTGDLVRIGELQGKIVRITRTGLILRRRRDRHWCRPSSSANGSRSI